MIIQVMVGGPHCGEEFKINDTRPPRTRAFPRMIKQVDISKNLDDVSADLNYKEIVYAYKYMLEGRAYYFYAH